MEFCFRSLAEILVEIVCSVSYLFGVLKNKRVSFSFFNLNFWFGSLVEILVRNC